MPKTTKSNLSALLVNWLKQPRVGFLAGKRSNWLSPAKQKPSTQLIAFLVLSLAVVGIGTTYLINSNWAGALPPTVTTVAPSSGPDSGGQTVTINGADFTKAAGFRPGSLSVGSDYACAITLETDWAYCWGANNFGQLGNNGTADSLVPIAVDDSGILNNKTIKQIAVGWHHTCVIASDDQAYCWGRNSAGQLGNGETIDSLTPVAVNTSGVLNGKTIKQITIGWIYTCAIASDDQAYCWGGNTNGQLGYGGTADSHIPTAVNTDGALNGKTIKQIVANNSHTCAIASDDQAYCWGQNDIGQAGDGLSSAMLLTPSAVDTSGALNNKTVKQIAVGTHHTCAIASDDLAYCWGYNIVGFLGDNSTNDSYVPVAVYTGGVLNNKTIKQITASGVQTCVLASDDQTYCWGLNNNGHLGNDSSIMSALAPTAVDSSGPLNNQAITQINSGEKHTCVIGSDGQAYCWGDNNSGQLGDGSSGFGTSRYTPTPVDTSNLPIVPNVQSILFGSIPATNFTIDSVNQLTATAPPHPAGLVDVTLLDAKNQPVVLASSYTFTGKPTTTTPQTPGTGIGNNHDALVALISVLLLTTGLSLFIYQKSKRRIRWFGR